MAIIAREKREAARRAAARRAREKASRKKAAVNPLQALWDANGAAIYAANQAFKTQYGKNMSAKVRRKAIKDATRNGHFNAGAYAGNLVVKELERQIQAANSGGGGKPLYSPASQDGNNEWPSEADKPWVHNPPWNMNGGSVPTATPTPTLGSNILSTVWNFMENGLPEDIIPLLVHEDKPLQSNCAILPNAVLREMGVGLFSVKDIGFVRVPETHRDYAARNGEYRYTIKDNVLLSNISQSDILEDLKEMAGDTPAGAFIFTIPAETYPNYYTNKSTFYGHMAIGMGNGQIAELSGPSYWQQNENGQYIGERYSGHENVDNPYFYNWLPNSSDPIAIRSFYNPSSVPTETLTKGIPDTPFPNDYIVPRMTSTISIVPPDPITEGDIHKLLGTTPQQVPLSEFLADKTEYVKEDCYVGATGKILQQYICLPSTPTKVSTP